MKIVDKKNKLGVSNILRKIINRYIEIYIYIFLS